MQTVPAAARKAPPPTAVRPPAHRIVRRSGSTAYIDVAAAGADEARNTKARTAAVKL